MSTEIQLLKDPGTEPSDKNLEDVLGQEKFDIYKELVNHGITRQDLTFEWRYYNDGKAWLCKSVYRKKTVFWLSLWENYIKISFYFTAKTSAGVYDLEISEDIRESLRKSDNTGKLIPLILDIDKREQLSDLWGIVRYKKSLK
ncbi:MAG: DUF3788 family protein [Prolixibacteraceae bacterium]|nr:DUF3788 family protein [Prolixibacteraceae bacterium]